ncbi:hypothetical protein [Salmon gill poxvirus]|nr:hypothetical protein [Salmon gill poxvirus]
MTTVKSTSLLIVDKPRFSVDILSNTVVSGNGETITNTIVQPGPVVTNPNTLVTNTLVTSSVPLNPVVPNTSVANTSVATSVANTSVATSVANPVLNTLVTNSVSLNPNPLPLQPDSPQVPTGSNENTSGNSDIKLFMENVSLSSVTSNIKNRKPETGYKPDEYTDTNLDNIEIDYNYIDPAVFSSVLTGYNKTIQKKKTINFTLRSDTFSISHDNIPDTIMYYLSKHSTNYEMKNINWTKIHWYYIADILIVDYIKNKSTRGTLETKILNTITVYLTRIKSVPKIMDIWNECVEFIGNNAFMDDSVSKSEWISLINAHITTHISKKSDQLKILISDFYKCIITKMSPNIVIGQVLTQLETLMSSLRIKKFSTMEILYYFWKSCRNVLITSYTTEYLYTAFTSYTSELDKFFKTPSGNLRSIDDGMGNLYANFITNTPFYSVFGEMNIADETINMIHLLYIYNIMLRYLNDGYSLDGSIFSTVNSIMTTYSGWATQMFPIPVDISNVKSVYEWCDNVRDYFSDFENISNFITLPEFTMERIENIFTREVRITGVLNMTPKPADSSQNRSVSISKNIMLTGNF